MEIYCGNNQFELGPGKRLGTPHECLKKGVGQGLHSDLSRFNPNYQAIIPDNSYCGSGVVPQGKTLGTPASCLRKGVGLGMKLQFERQLVNTSPRTERSTDAVRSSSRMGQSSRSQYHSARSSTSSTFFSARSTMSDDDVVEHFEPGHDVVKGPESSTIKQLLKKWWPVFVALLVMGITWRLGASWSTIATSSIVTLSICLVFKGVAGA